VSAPVESHRFEINIRCRSFGNFTSLPDGAKWLLALGMLLGRLEFFTVLVILSPAFWRQ